MSPRFSSGGKNVSELDLQFSFHRYRKLRLYFGWAFLIAVAFFAKSTDQGFLASVPLMLLGGALRVWSHGYLRKARELATSGPYAYVRNPLYMGNFLIGLGFCVVVWHPLIIFFFVVGFFAVYWVTIKGEEQRLRFKFKGRYENYIGNVPRFIPRFTPHSSSANARFALHRVFGHGEPITILGIILLYLILYLRQELYQDGKPFSALTYSLLGLFLLLGATMIVLMSMRYGTRKK